MKKTAVLSLCGSYRYRLEREWDADWPKVAFIMLNPSTADDKEDDPTIRRCIAFAKSWGYGGIVVANLFALRATKPSALEAHGEPVGRGNDEWISEVASSCPEVVCAWGSNKFAAKRAAEVRRLLYGKRAVALKLNGDGSPGHPLYLKSDSKRISY